MLVALEQVKVTLNGIYKNGVTNPPFHDLRSSIYNLGSLQGKLHEMFADYVCTPQSVFITLLLIWKLGLKYPSACAEQL